MGIDQMPRSTPAVFRDFDDLSPHAGRERQATAPVCDEEDFGMLLARDDTIDEVGAAAAQGDGDAGEKRLYSTESSRIVHTAVHGPNDDGYAEVGDERRRLGRYRDGLMHEVDAVVSNQLLDHAALDELWLVEQHHERSKGSYGEAVGQWTAQFSDELVVPLIGDVWMRSCSLGKSTSNSGRVRP